MTEPSSVEHVIWFICIVKVHEFMHSCILCNNNNNKSHCMGHSSQSFQANRTVYLELFIGADGNVHFTCISI